MFTDMVYSNTYRPCINKYTDLLSFLSYPTLMAHLKKKTDTDGYLRLSLKSDE